MDQVTALDELISSSFFFFSPHFTLFLVRVEKVKGMSGLSTRACLYVVTRGVRMSQRLQQSYLLAFTLNDSIRMREVYYWRASQVPIY